MGLPARKARCCDGLKRWGTRDTAAKEIILAGWGTWIRTKTNRVRVCCATVTPFPNFPSNIRYLCWKLTAADEQGPSPRRRLRSFYPHRAVLGKHSESLGGFHQTTAQTTAGNPRVTFVVENRECDTERTGNFRLKNREFGVPKQRISLKQTANLERRNRGPGHCPLPLYKLLCCDIRSAVCSAPASQARRRSIWRWLCPRPRPKSSTTWPLLL